SLALGAAGCEGTPPGGGQVAPGQPAPAFEARVLGGDRLAVGDLRGEVVVLNVWATWCIPCVREMPALEALHRELREDGLRVVAVSIDRGSAEAEVRRFIQDHDITFTVLLDPDQRVTGTFRTIGVPETFVIDRDGTIAHRWFGEIEPEALRDQVAELLRTSAI
ncbi:MAG TPA: TlpA disulfide reductase family protein, partial [Longimicrobiales bacterium]|nr:TlpA disulfide reductase family protein [Longimicrobiales bacterium]